MRKRTGPPTGGLLLRVRQVLVCLLLFLFPLLLPAQIATWEFDGASLNVTYVETGLQGAAATAGSGVVSAGVTTACTGFAWQGAGFNKNNRMSANKDYAEFRLTAPGRQLTIRTIFFTANSAAGPPAGPQQASIWINDTWLAMNGSSIFTLTRDNTCRVYGVVADAPVSIAAGTTAVIRIHAWGGDASGLLRLDDVFVYGSLALPIELTSFTGQALDEAVQLTWTTASELDNDYMAVERSAGGLAFDEIGRVTGRGTTYETQSYSFLDRSPLAGINYYRLRQVDFDGTTAYHPVISVQFNGGSRFEFRAFPNPAKEEVRVQWRTLASPGPSPLGDKKPGPEGVLRLLDVSGKLLAQYALSGSGGIFNVPVEQLPAGIYLIQWTQGGRAQAQKVVKN